MPRELQLSSDQVLATDRANLEGRVYLLSGTLPGRRVGTSSIEFKWATTTFSGALGQFEQYIDKPQQVLRGQEFVAGGGSTQPAIRIPVRNLKFGEAESLVAAIDDGVYAWENAEASLLVGYLRQGQSAADLVSGDWTYLVKDGFLGAPESIELDGFNLLLYNRGARRNQVFKQLTTWAENEIAPDSLYPGGVSRTTLAADKRDFGVPLPIVVGKPDSWYRLPTINIGTRGSTTSGFSAGATEVEFKRRTAGREVLVSGNKFFIHTRKPIYTISGVDYNDETETIKLYLTSGLAIDVPRGAVVQHWGKTISGLNDTYKWVMAGHTTLYNGYVHSADTWKDPNQVNCYGWLRENGEIVPVDLDKWPIFYGVGTVGSVAGIPLSYTPGSLYHLPTVIAMMHETYTGLGEDSPVAPCFFPPNNETIADVETQPKFTSTQTLSSKLNYPTGGTGANNANARDGNENTSVNIALGTITLTFNSAPSPFADGDTTESTLHVMVNGGPITITDSLGSTTFGVASGAAGQRQQFRFTQASARDYNATMRFTGTGFLIEAWWEHDLSKEVESTRTQDVALTTSGGAAVGEVLEFADLVYRVKSTGFSLPHGAAYPNRSASAFNDYSRKVQDDEVLEVDDQGSWYGSIPYPDTVMTSLQSMLLGASDGSLVDMNLASYDAARVRFIENDVRLSFVITEKLASWTELERELAIQSRSHMYYGPSGHEIVFMEDAADLTASGIVQEFRLPGTPGTNAMRGAGQLLERIPASQVVNAAEAEYTENYIDGGYASKAKATDADSVATHGERRDPRTGTSYSFWAHSVYPEHPSYDAAVSVSGILDHYASRAAFGATRFKFDTAWIAHGVERGSPVRVVYEVGKGAYRNVICEVEEVAVSPINGDRFSLSCRAVELPARGLPAFTWVDRYTRTTDVWTDEIYDYETWANRWSPF